MLNYAIMYKETSGIKRTFIVVFTDQQKANEFAVYTNHNGDVPPVDENSYYDTMVREVQINPESPPKHHSGVPLQYVNSIAFPVSDSDDRMMM